VLSTVWCVEVLLWRLWVHLQYIELSHLLQLASGLNDFTLYVDFSWRTGGEVNGKLANGMGSQYPSHNLGTWCIQHYYRWWRTPRLPVVDWTDAPRRFKWTHPFRRKTKSGFCACAITFQLASTTFVTSRPFISTVRNQLKCDGTRWLKGGEVKGKLANAVGSQYPSHYLGTWCIQHYYRRCTHLGCQ